MPVDEFFNISARETVSDAMNTAKDAIKEASDSMEEATASSEAMSEGFEDASRSARNLDNNLEDLRNTMGQIIGMGPSMAASIKSLEGIDIDDSGGLIDFLRTPLGGEETSRLVKTPEFKQSMKEAFNIDSSQWLDIKKLMLREDIQNMDELIHRIQKLDSVVDDTDSIARRLFGAMQTTGKMLDLIDTDDLAGEMFDDISFRQLLDTDEFKNQFKDAFDISGQQWGSFKSAISDEDVENVQQLVDRMEQFPDLFSNMSRPEKIEAAETAITQTAAATGYLEEQAEDADDEVNGLTRSIVKSIATSGIAGGAFHLLAERIDEVGDESKDTERQIDNLSDTVKNMLPSFSSVSANIGPFNVALKGLTTTVPMLIATIGPLISMVFSLATAFVAAASAVGAFMALGAVQFAEKLQKQFAGVTSQAKAFEAIMKGLKEALMQALRPLSNAQFAGMSGAQFFLETIRSVVLWVNMAAEGLAELLSMREVEAFFFRIRNALLGIGQAGDGVAMLDAMKEAVRELLPVVTDLIVFFIDNMPEFIQWATHIAEDVVPALEMMVPPLLAIVKELSEFGAEVMRAAAPGLRILLGGFALFIDTVHGLYNALGPLKDEITSTAIVALTLGFAIGFVIVKMAKLTWLLVSIAPYLKKLGVIMYASATSGGVLATVISGLTTVLGYVAGGIVTVAGALASTVGIIAALVGIVFVLIGAYAYMITHMEEVMDFYDWFEKKLKNVLMAMGLTEEEASKLSEALIDMNRVLMRMQVDFWVGVFEALGDAIMFSYQKLDGLASKFGFIDDRIKTINNRLRTFQNLMESTTGLNLYKNGPVKPQSAAAKRGANFWSGLGGGSPILKPLLRAAGTRIGQASAQRTQNRQQQSGGKNITINIGPGSGDGDLDLARKIETLIGRDIFKNDGL